MKSLTYKLIAILLILALAPLVIGVGAALALRTAEKAVRETDGALRILSGVMAETDESISENARLQARATGAAGQTADSQAETSQALQNMRDSVLPRTFAIARIRHALSRATAAERALLLTLVMRHPEPEELEAVRARSRENMAAAITTLDESAKLYEARIGGDAEQNAWNDFAATLAPWKASNEEFTKEIARLEAMEGDPDRDDAAFRDASRKAYDAIFIQSRAARQECEKRIDVLAATLGDVTDASVRQALDSQQRSRRQLADLFRDAEEAKSRAEGLASGVHAAGAAADRAAEAAGSVGAAARRFRYLVAFALAGGAATLLAGIVAAIRLSRPLRETAARLAKLSRGERAGDVPEKDAARADEIGQLARSVRDLLESNRAAIGMLNAMAGGDYAIDVPMRSEGDMLGHAMNAMLAKTNSVLARLGHSVERLHAGAQSASDASRSLSQGAETSAQSLEEISETMSAVDEQAQENAASAIGARKIAEASRDAARRGYDAVSGLVSAMDEIRQAGGRIASVAKLIDDIAFQTNLLALNAAVEAARAGRQGRGFSVVADEVRNLSGRSAKAARETGAMVEAMTRRMDAGAELAEKSDSEFREIVEAATRVVQVFEEIASASDSQSEAIAEISRGLGQIDMVIQETSGNASWTAKAALALSRQADDLRDLVSRFRTRSGPARMGGFADQPRMPRASGPGRLLPGPRAGETTEMRETPHE